MKKSAILFPLLIAVFFIAAALTSFAAVPARGFGDAVKASPSNLEEAVDSPDAGDAAAAKRLLAALPAAGPSDVVTETETLYYVNPLYRHILSEEELRKRFEEETGIRKIQKLGASAGSPDYIESVAEFAGILRETMKAREAEVTVFSETLIWKDIQPELVEKLFAHDFSDPAAGDYLKWQYAGIAPTTRKHTVTEAGGGQRVYYEYVIKLSYYTTADQEAEVDERIGELLEELSLPAETRYETASAIYRYITDTVEYDYDNPESYDLKYTCYAALFDKKAVCQGYSLLFYRLALESGIDCRLIPGTAGSVNHGWNIVQMDDGYYYNIDATWDAGNDPWNWFLKCPDTFVRHTRFSDYSTEAFELAYPMGPSDYALPVPWEIPVPDSAVLTETGITFSWFGQEQAPGYRVYRKTGDGSFTALSDTGNEFFTDTGILGGNTYTYTVSILNSEGEEVTGYDPDGVSLTVLPAPKIESMGSGSAGMVLTWKTVPGAARYRIFRKEGAGEYSVLYDAAALRYTDPSVSPGVRYSYILQCLGENGEPAGVKSAARSYTFLAAPKVLTPEPAAGGILVKWEAAPAAERYIIYRSVGKTLSWKYLTTVSAEEGDVQSYLTPGVESGSWYAYTVRTLSADGTYLSVRPAGKAVRYLAAPKIKSLKNTSSGIQITFGKVNGGFRYRIYRSEYKAGSGFGSCEKLLDVSDKADPKGYTVTEDAIICTDKTAKNGTRYRYRIRCVNVSGTEELSSYDPANRELLCKR